MALEQHPARAGVRGRGAVGVARGGAALHEDPDVRDAARALAPRLLRLDLGVGLADQRVGPAVHLAGGVALVADGALRAPGEHRGALVAQRVRVLEAAELAPALVELAGHPEVVQSEALDELRAEREVVVAPAARRERLELEVREERKEAARAELRSDVAAVVEDTHRRIELARGGGGALVVEAQRLDGGAVDVLRPVEPQSVLAHPALAPFAAAGLLADDVEEDAVGVGEEPARLADLFAEVVQVGRAEAHRVEAGLRGLRDPAEVLALVVHRPPLGVLVRGDVVHARGKVDRRRDADLLRGVHLRAQEVEAQVRVHPPDGRRMVGPAVVALREERDRVDVAEAKRLLEARFVELRPDPVDVGRGVEIEVDLAEAEAVAGCVHGGMGEGWRRGRQCAGV